MLNQVHLATQYLAMAGKSFLDHRSDDSHTNISFNIATQSFESWDLDENGLKLTFDLPSFQLKWISHDTLTLPLNGKCHADVVKWLEKSAIQLGIKKPYAFDLHYELPFQWNDGHTFELSQQSYLTKEVALRTLANEVLKSFLNSENLQSDIRIWPHHFDTGAFVVLGDGSGKSIGMGMAIPDAMVDDHYFYISGYLGYDGIDTSNFSALELGEWKNEGFKGAFLPASVIGEENAIQFLQEAYSKYVP